ncbi:hypothetical protein BJ742DRAFT_785234 [Cladochytrium replicatum]|nr:hypothetical protein BJ742DRAFT_785234 [Cladochytrium replicatum]
MAFRTPRGLLPLIVLGLTVVLLNIPHLLPTNEPLIPPPPNTIDCTKPFDLTSRSNPGILFDFRAESPPSDILMCKFANGNDFESTWMKRLVPLIDGGSTMTYHRKQWEISYIAYVVESLNLCGPGKRGMVWAVGKERLVSYFASKGCEVLASDMSEEGDRNFLWKLTNQHSNSKEHLFHPSLIDRASFEKRVWFRNQDMNFVPADLRGTFNFVWSTCSVEHVGSILLGQRFVLNSMDMLAPGGVAIHTVEFTLSSDGKTVDFDNTVLWRKQDFERLAASLRHLGYEVFPIAYGAGNTMVDQTPDVPPYQQQNHLKLILGEHIVTSFAMIIRKPSNWKDPVPKRQGMCVNGDLSLEVATA